MGIIVKSRRVPCHKTMAVRYNVRRGKEERTTTSMETGYLYSAMVGDSWSKDQAERDQGGFIFKGRFVEVMVFSQVGCFG